MPTNVEPNEKTAGQQTTIEPITSTPDDRLRFPEWVMRGSLGELACILARGTEVPEEFIFATAITVIGAACAGDLRLNIGVTAEPRLFTVLLGDSYLARKSTAMRKVLDFFNSLSLAGPMSVVHGVGSGEGLAKLLNKHGRVLLALDEFRGFIDKAKIDGSSLLTLAASMYEINDWDNSTKYGDLAVHNGHLAIVGCCTTRTYSQMWSPDAIALGFPNRLFVVNADAKPKVAWPEPPVEAELQHVREWLVQQFKILPRTLDITPEAKRRWGEWYESLPDSEHAKRLDTIGYRLMLVLALTNDKTEVDSEIVEMVIAILNYELRVRILTDPIDADNTIARLEEGIRRQLGQRGPLKLRDLKRYTNAQRHGQWAFERALVNVQRAGEVNFDVAIGVYRLLN